MIFNNMLSCLFSTLVPTARELVFSVYRQKPVNPKIVIYKNSQNWTKLLENLYLLIYYYFTIH